MTSIYITIGNSDDKLTQAEWAAFHMRSHEQIHEYASHIHGVWTSGSTSMWQNACWCVEVHRGVMPTLKNHLTRLAREYRQDSIAWAEADVEFLTTSATTEETA